MILWDFCKEGLIPSSEVTKQENKRNKNIFHHSKILRIPNHLTVKWKHHLANRQPHQHSFVKYHFITPNKIAVVKSIKSSI